MAKTGFWLKGATGKLAGTTMYKDPTTGETVMREIVKPSNPKTEKQLIQRIIMHTIGSAYSLMKEICDHSFEGKKAGRETMSYFMQQNIQFCRQKVAEMVEQGLGYDEIYNFMRLGVKGFCQNQYQLSMGSLPQVDVTTYRVPVSAVESQMRGCVPVITANTYQDVIEVLGLQRGDQLTFLTITQTRVDRVAFQFARVILDPTDPETHLALPLSTEFVTMDGAINAPSVRNEGDFNFILNENGLIFKPNKQLIQGTGSIGSCAVIVSRKVGDQWNRSTAYLTYDENYTSYGESLQECIDAAAEGVQNPLYAPNELYLNNAGTGGAATAGGSEEGGEGVTQAVVQSCLIDNNSAIRGTKKVVTKPNGTTFPVAIVVDGTVANGDGKTVTIVKVSDSSVLASDVVADGEFAINANAAKDTDYAVKLDGAATGFTFRIEEAAEQGGGGGGADTPAILTASFAGVPLSAGVPGESSSDAGTVAGTTEYANGQFISVVDAADDSEIASNPISGNAFSVSVNGLQEGHSYRIYIVDEENQKLTSIIWGWNTISADED